MSRAVGNATTSHAWDVAASSPDVLQDGSNTYVYGLGPISATDGSGVQTYFLHDGFGSTVALTDGSGTVTATYEYDAFGGIRSQTGSATNPWEFTGQQLDAESSLYFLRARFYGPAAPGHWSAANATPRDGTGAVVTVTADDGWGRRPVVLVGRDGRGDRRRAVAIAPPIKRPAP